MPPKRRFTILEDSWLSQWLQSPLKPPTETPDVKTQSEMLEDAQIARSGSISKTAAQWKKYKSQVDAGLSDKLESPIVVPAGTFVYVTDKSRTLIAHKLKKDHMFLSCLTGSTLELLTGADNPEVPDSTTPAELLKLDYYTFETNNRDWPYMIVPRSQLKVEEKITGVSTDMMMFDEFMNIYDSK